MFVVDTNVVSELRRLDRANPGLKAWADSVATTDIFMASVSLFELELGVRSRERRDPAQGRLLRAWFDGQVQPRFEGRILPFDAAAALRCAAFHIPDPRSERDAMIAAIASIHRMAVVTRNVSDFEPLGVPVVNPWT